MRAGVQATENQFRPTRCARSMTGLGAPRSAWIADLRKKQLSLAGAGFVFALGAQLLAAAIVMGAALSAGRPILGIVIASALGGVAGLAAFLILSAEQFAKLAVGTRVAMLLGASILFGAAQAAIRWEAVSLATGTMTNAALLATAASLTIALVALLPVRIAALGFAVASWLGIAALSGSASVVLLGGLFILCLAMLLFRLTAFDLVQAGKRARMEGETLLARRLVREYENQGTGWFWETDRRGRLTYLSETVVREFEVPREQIIGRQLTELFEMDSEAADTERTLTFHLSSRTSFSEYSVNPVGGSKDRWWSISGRPIIDNIGQFRGFIGTGSDLTAKRRSEAEITRLALFDSLTGLANRQRMKLSLDQTLTQHSNGYRPTSLFLLDLDRFKAVNDTLGHQVGDELLKQVGARLQRTIGDAGLVGRLGGDEFKIVLPGENDREKLGKLAKSVIAALSQPYAISGASISIGASLGIAVSPDDGETSETLIRNADLALYAAKADGRGVHRFYREEMLAGAQSRKQLEDDLRKAVAGGHFHLNYQPVVSTTGARIVGFEALIRWTHPTRGPVSPSDFIPVAEDCGLIEKIGEWVLRTACVEAAAWPEWVRVGVNVSPIQFANPALPRIVTEALLRSGLAPGRLELEITESVFVNESASTDQMFAELKAIGVRLALDDFGTGYSSLGYLRKAPFDKIKIDQSFVRGAAIEGSRNAAIIKAIVTLANTLGMETTAEGVELQDEIELIRELGCSHIQGFVYGRPMLAVDAQKLLESEGGQASALGHKVSRAPRNKMLRSAILEIGGVQHSVRIRNISRTGAMIDGFESGEVGDEVLIELMDDQMFRAHLRWMQNGKAGLEFAEAFNLERLKTAPEPRPALWRV